MIKADNIYVPESFTLSETERRRAKKFIREHRNAHDGAHFDYRFSTGSGIGIGVSIICTECGEELDITDYSTW